MNRPDSHRLINLILTWIAVILSFLAIQSWMLDYMYNNSEGIIHKSINVALCISAVIIGFYIQHKMRKK